MVSFPGTFSGAPQFFRGGSQLFGNRFFDFVPEAVWPFAPPAMDNEGDVLFGGFESSGDLGFRPSCLF